MVQLLLNKGRALGLGLTPSEVRAEVPLELLVQVLAALEVLAVQEVLEPIFLLMISLMHSAINKHGEDGRDELLHSILSRKRCLSAITLKFR